MPHLTLYPRCQNNEERVDPPSHLSAAEAHHTPVTLHYPIYPNIRLYHDHFVTCRLCFIANSPARCCTITVCNCCLTIRLCHHHCTVQTLSLIMTASHVATLCPPTVCQRLLQTTLSPWNTVDCRLLCTPAVAWGSTICQFRQKITTCAMLCQSKNRGSWGRGTVL